MKILFKGNLFNPTGMATVNRETVKALVRAGVKVQVTDPWHDKYDFNKGLERLNDSINVADEDVVTIFADYPHHWREAYGSIYGEFVHEGTRLHEGWAQGLNQAKKLFVPSTATKNLFRWNGVTVPIEVIPHGTNPLLYKPRNKDVELNDNEFAFLSINSWTGLPNDRKGTDLLIKAFDEEFKNDKDVKLILKIGTFWQGPTDYLKSIYQILGHINENIIFNDQYATEEHLSKLYNDCDCFVAPTRGEGFGLTILDSLASGLPVIVTDDLNSGHMDFCKGREGVLLVGVKERKQGDPRFYTNGCLLAEPDFEELKKQMRYAYEHKKEIKEKALRDSEFIRENYTWDLTAAKIIKFLEDGEKDKGDVVRG